MNFLTFPLPQGDLLLWGAGGAAASLGQAEWLQNKPIYYWGDLDSQGFVILSQLREKLPQTRSFLMTRRLLEQYHKWVVPGAEPTTEPKNLQGAEWELFHALRAENLRLEQERIPLAAVREALRELAGAGGV